MLRSDISRWGQFTASARLTVGCGWEGNRRCVVALASEMEMSTPPTPHVIIKGYGTLYLLPRLSDSHRDFDERSWRVAAVEIAFSIYLYVCVFWWGAVDVICSLFDWTHSRTLHCVISKCIVFCNIKCNKSHIGLLLFITFHHSTCNAATFCFQKCIVLFVVH